MLIGYNSTIARIAYSNFTRAVALMPHVNLVSILVKVDILCVVDDLSRVDIPFAGTERRVDTLFDYYLFAKTFLNFISRFLVFCAQDSRHREIFYAGRGRGLTS